MAFYDPLTFWRFAGDAERLAVIGAAMLLSAVAALAMERLRTRKALTGRAGWMPWTGIFLVLVMAGAALITTALPVLMQDV